MCVCVCVCVAVLRFKQREHVGPVRVWGSPITRNVGLGGWEGVYGPSGIQVSIPARLHPLCLGHIINANSHSRDAGNTIYFLMSLQFWRV